MVDTLPRQVAALDPLPCGAVVDPPAPVGEEFLTDEGLGCVSPWRGREEAQSALWWQGACLEKARGGLCGRKSYARCWGLCHTSYEKPLESARLLCQVKKCV